MSHIGCHVCSSWSPIQVSSSGEVAGPSPEVQIDIIDKFCAPQAVYLKNRSFVTHLFSSAGFPKKNKKGSIGAFRTWENIASKTLGLMQVDSRLEDPSAAELDASETSATETHRPYMASVVECNFYKLLRGFGETWHKTLPAHSAQLTKGCE